LFVFCFIVFQGDFRNTRKSFLNQVHVGFVFQKTA
jgi:hypothetical protein